MPHRRSILAARRREEAGGGGGGGGAGAGAQSPSGHSPGPLPPLQWMSPRSPSLGGHLYPAEDSKPGARPSWTAAERAHGERAMAKYRQTRTISTIHDESEAIVTACDMNEDGFISLGELTAALCEKPDVSCCRHNAAAPRAHAASPGRTIILLVAFSRHKPTTARTPVGVALPPALVPSPPVTPQLLAAVGLKEDANPDEIFEFFGRIDADGTGKLDHIE